MPETTPILEFDKQHFVIRLCENMLKIDLKGNITNELLEALENKPLLRETIGSILGIFVPLHIHLNDIESVKTDETGKVEMVLPRHRDVIIPLQPNEAKKLVDKLNELIPKEKRKELLRLIEERKLQRTAEEQLEIGRAAATYPIQHTELMAPELDEELAKAKKKEEQKTED